MRRRARPLTSAPGNWNSSGELAGRVSFMLRACVQDFTGVPLVDLAAMPRWCHPTGGPGRTGQSPSAGWLVIDHSVQSIISAGQFAFSSMRSRIPAIVSGMPFVHAGHERILRLRWYSSSAIELNELDRRNDRPHRVIIRANRLKGLTCRPGPPVGCTIALAPDPRRRGRP